jgi:histidinol-phosphate aminotransferase
MNLFKPHIEQAKPYKGGSTREESSTKGGSIKEHSIKERGSAGAATGVGPRTIYKLSSNENLLGPSPKAILAIQNNLHSLNEYRYENDKVFCETLSDFFGRAPGAAEHRPGATQHRPEATQFITANSGMELLDLICRGFLEPGAECILSTPTFLAYKSFAGIEGARVVDVPLKDAGFADAPPKDTDFALDVEGILAAVNERTRILFIANPNNPTGSFFSKQSIDRLIGQLPPHVVVIYDEVYYHYVDKPDYARAIDYIEQGKNIIGIHSFSKAYGLAGIRLGYAFSTPEIAGYLHKLRRPFMINTLSMEAGIAALGDREHIRRTVNNVITEKEWLYKQLKEQGIAYWESQANFILFRSPYANEAFVRDMLEQGIMVRSGEVFGAPGCCRVTIGDREANRAFGLALEEIMALGTHDRELRL